MTGDKRKRGEADQGQETRDTNRQRVLAAASSAPHEAIQAGSPQHPFPVGSASPAAVPSLPPASSMPHASGGATSGRDARLFDTASQHRRLRSLNSQNATQIISTYIGSLRNDLSVHNARYVVEQEEPPSSFGNEVRCTLYLPHNCPIRAVTPDGTFRSKREARQAAAYDAVLALNVAGEIDDDLRPTPANPTHRKRSAVQPSSALENESAHPTKARTKDSSDSNNYDVSSTPLKAANLETGTKAITGSKTINGDANRSRSDISCDAQQSGPTAAQQQGPIQAPSPTVLTVPTIPGQDTYPAMMIPRFWLESPPLGPTLHLTMMQLLVERSSSSRALVMLTCCAVPVLPLGKDVDLDVSHPAGKGMMRLRSFPSITLDERQLSQARVYTRCLFRAVLNKPIEPNVTPYLFLPLKATFSSTSISVTDFAWDEVGIAQGPPVRALDFTHEAMLRRQIDDAVLSVPMELGRRFYAIRLADEMTPNSPSPLNNKVSLLEAATGRHAFEYGYRPDTEHGLLSQSVIEAQHVIGAKSGGAVVAPDKQLHYLLPQFLSLHVLPASVFAPATVIPAALTALDDELVAYHLCNDIFAASINHDLVRQAITCPASRPLPDQENYERLEMLGDTILKLLVTVGVYHDMYSGHSDGWQGGTKEVNCVTASTKDGIKDGNCRAEGVMTRDRQVVVSNTALRKAVIAAGVVPYIRNTCRRQRDFIPHGWEVSNAHKGLHNTTSQTIGDKTIADVGEALLAAAYLTPNAGHIARLQHSLDALHTLRIPMCLRRWTDLRGMPPLTDAFQPLELLGYKFNNPACGRAALSLATANRQRVEAYEFLGDGIIDYLTVLRLWQSNASLGPAPLTHMKHSRVSNSAFAAFLVHSGLISYVTDVDPGRQTAIDAYAVAIRGAQTRADERIAMDQEAYEYWSTLPEHKFLGDIVEALFGAMLEDSGFNVAIVAEIYYTHLWPFVDRYGVPPRAHSLHPKSALIVLLSKVGCCHWALKKRQLPQAHSSAPQWSCTVKVHGRRIGTASAPTHSLAVRNACAEALAYCEDNDILGTLCDCRELKKKGHDNEQKKVIPEIPRAGRNNGQ